MSTLGTKIRRLREIKGLKQEYMADKLGVSKNAYSKMEKGETNISQERLEQISNALEVPIQDILAFEEKLVINFINSSISHNSPAGSNENNTYHYAYYASDERTRILEEINHRLKEENEKLKAEIEKLKSGK